MERQQLLTKGQIFKHEVLTGLEDANHPAEKMPEPRDHGRNLIETSSHRLVAKSLILRMYGVLMTHTGSGLGPWYLARAKALSVGLSNAYFKSLGLPTLIDGC